MTISEYRRRIIGILSLVLLTGAVILVIRGGEGTQYTTLLAACVRLGIMSGAVWLAFPQLTRIPRWIAALGLVTFVLGAINPRTLPITVPLFFLVIVMRPKGPSKRSGGKSQGQQIKR
jgi:hypothetical protein